MSEWMNWNEISLVFKIVKYFISDLPLEIPSLQFTPINEDSDDDNLIDPDELLDPSPSSSHMVKIEAGAKLMFCNPGSRVYLNFIFAKLLLSLPGKMVKQEAYVCCHPDCLTVEIQNFQTSQSLSRHYSKLHKTAYSDYRVFLKKNHHKDLIACLKAGQKQYNAEYHVLNKLQWK